MAKKEKTKKDAQLIVRITKTERDAFVELCEELDTSAAREVRRFIREFLARHEDGDTAGETKAK
ncbi:hypothetical protein [Maritimibacter sp. DP1N21-5]|uniref:hypothetical protein n=1 Tax=Maritimibacter sp. DP1N21-5 TaxID=2836867 RepID=UPI001C4663A0|nr:hypothetical protein [Maritimibacter sp. DP1N21-5]MBV7409418.1 hypothetical protein [Maritimibacter sp. DP1N21-5]